MSRLFIRALVGIVVIVSLAIAPMAFGFSSVQHHEGSSVARLMLPDPPDIIKPHGNG